MFSNQKWTELYRRRSLDVRALARWAHRHTTIGRWNKTGVMDEECLSWDNRTFMKQIGLGS